MPRLPVSSRLAAASICVWLASPLAAGDWIFSSGFESGTLCHWSSSSDGSICPSTLDEEFSRPDGAAWPSPWQAVGGVALADVQGGRARLRPSPSGYSLARMVAPLGAVDAEAVFTAILEDDATQGIGFYLRQNGGYLQDPDLPGAGYAVFLEGSFRGMPGIGVWKEEDGHEIPLDHASPLAPTAGVPYRVRFRLEQEDVATTRLRARVWRASEPEPFHWDVDHLDSTASLQGVAGGAAIDSWSVVQEPNPISASTLVDDVEVHSLLDPVGGAALAQVSSGFQFTEGPLWRGDHLLFSDITADTIHRLDLPSTVGVFRTPSGHANGLASAVGGDLLAAEHEHRRISRTDAQGTVTTVVSHYQGLALNSPNDLAVRSDGTLYFTDPDYGLPGERELPFNGLFRLTPEGILAAEWEGSPPDDQPNGVALSPDERTLYVTDTASGEVHAWSVATDGSLSDRRVFADGLSTPDGMCLDRLGNVWVATWGEGVVVLSPSGARIAVLSAPTAATNCAFGGDGRDLWVTGQTALHHTRTLVSGL